MSQYESHQLLHFLLRTKYVVQLPVGVQLLCGRLHRNPSGGVCGLIRTVAASLYCVAGTGESRQTAAALLVDIPDFTIGLSDYQPHTLLDSF